MQSNLTSANAAASTRNAATMVVEVNAENVQSLGMSVWTTSAVLRSARANSAEMTPATGTVVRVLMMAMCALTTCVAHRYAMAENVVTTDVAAPVVVA